MESIECNLLKSIHQALSRAKCLLPPWHSPASLLLLLLLSADVMFLGLHLVYLQTSIIADRGFWLEQDRGYAGVFQYIKEYWTAMLMACCPVASIGTRDVHPGSL